MAPATVTIIQNLAYLVASVLFIRGLKGLTHPRTAVRGNLTGSLAMLIAVLATLWAGGIVSWTWIIAGLLIGSVAGTTMALKVPMTAMPEMVAVFNGFGGARVGQSFEPSDEQHRGNQVGQVLKSSPRSRRRCTRR